MNHIWSKKSQKQSQKAQRFPLCADDGSKIAKIKENYFCYLSKKAQNILSPKWHDYFQKIFYQSTIKDNYRQLSHLLAGGGVDAVTTEDEELAV